ncbi:hypothetical protein BXQ17_13965 [Polaribacter sp. BM10]|uniref:EpsG family protein n=1 Tax=Polaribacter sp. BM10 TaxID=1529069 RepID=UPI00098B6857|nr:EpsG family protein [Polaribacter sp. BM10]AQS95114.1 hypothetical protein BXQ17_13965 [Polaribacter sp. BM10]
MAIYIYTYIFLFLILLLSFSNNNKTNPIIMFLIVGYLLLFGGLRYDVGVDYLSYKDFFHYITIGYNTYLEISFILLVRIIDFFGGSFQLLFFVYNLLILLFLLKFLDFFSINKVYSLFIFVTIPLFYFASFNTMRQWVAVAVFAYSLKFIIKKQIYKYMLCMLLAVLMHKSAFLIIPLYFILNKKISLKLYTIVAFIFFISLNFVSIIITKIGFSSVYTNIELETDEKLNILIFPLILLFVLIWKLKFKHKNLVLNMIFISILISFAPILVPSLPNSWALRITSYFTICLLFAIPNISLSLSSKPLRQISISLIILVCSAYYFRTLLVLGERYKLVPYNINFDLFNL